MQRALIGKLTEGMDFETPSFSGFDDGRCIFKVHFVANARDEQQAVIGLSLVLKDDRLIQADREVGRLYGLVLDNHFCDLRKKLFLLVLQPGKDPQIHDRIAVRGACRDKI